MTTPRTRKMKTKIEKSAPRQLDVKRWRACAIDPRAFGGWYESGSAPTKAAGSVAIISIRGPLDHHNQWWLDSYDCIVDRIGDALGEPSVKAVILCFDSPGGDASGVQEAHQTIIEMKAIAKKPIFAYSNEACYSAAYWLACAADAIWLPITGGAGSIGVIAEAYDVSAYNAQHGVRVELVTTGEQKADGHAERVLTPEILARVQSRVDKLGAVFFASVATTRGMKPEAVEALQAGCFMGVDAVAAGLADGVASWDVFLDSVLAEVGA